MIAEVDVGAEPGVVLKHVILVYTAESLSRFLAPNPKTSYAIAAAANVDRDTGEVSTGAYEAVTMEFVQALAKGLGVDLPREILPENVLCRTQEVIVWWTPPAKRGLFFGDQTKLADLSGEDFPVPALVWRLDLKDRRLFLRAFAGDSRPDMGTELSVAPFLNVYDSALVCQGTMRRPNIATAQNLDAWETGFFGAEGSQQLAHKATTYKGQLYKLWRAVRRRKAFPEQYLLSADETLGDLLRWKS